MNLVERAAQMRSENTEPPKGWMKTSELAALLGFSANCGNSFRAMARRLVAEGYLEQKTYSRTAICYREVKKRA